MHASDQIALWDLQSGEPAKLLDAPLAGSYLALSPDGSLLVYWDQLAGGEKVVVLDTASGQPVHQIDMTNVMAGDIAFSPDGRVLATADFGFRISLWDVQTGGFLRLLETEDRFGGLMSISFSPDGSQLVAGGNWSGFAIWDVNSGEYVHGSLSEKVRLDCIAFDPQGAVIATSDGTRLQIWDWRTKSLAGVQDAYGRSCGLGIDPEKNRLYWGYDFYMNAWNLAPPRSAGSTSYANFANLVGGSIVAVSSDAQYMLLYANEDQMVIANRITGESALIYLPYNTTSISFSPNGRRVLIFTDKPELQVYNLYGGLVRKIPLSGDQMVILSKDSEIVMVNRSPSEIDFINANTGGVIKTVTLQEAGSYNPMSDFSTDLSLMVGMRGGRVILWDVTTGEPVAALKNICTTCYLSNAFFSPDGKMLIVTGPEGLFQVWGVMPGREPSAFPAELIPTLAPTATTAPPTPTSAATATQTATPTATPYPFSRTLSLTEPPMEGDDVLALQLRLLELGYTQVGTPDGVFGKMTDEAVRAFQSDKGLVVDGVVGPLTWEKLFAP